MLGHYFHFRGPCKAALCELYPKWTKIDKRFASIGAHIGGTRLLRQAPLECLISFICSSNNHISRITSMLESLRTEFGERRWCTFERAIIIAPLSPPTLFFLCAGEHLCMYQGYAYHAFPTLTQLQRATEAQLREMGFGYRAKFIVKTVQLLQERGGEEWLLGLR